MFKGAAKILSGIKNLFCCRRANCHDANDDMIEEEINNNPIQDITYQYDNTTRTIKLVTEIIYDNDLSEYNISGESNE